MLHRVQIRSREHSRGMRMQGLYTANSSVSAPARAKEARATGSFERLNRLYNFAALPLEADAMRVQLRKRRNAAPNLRGRVASWQARGAWRGGLYRPNGHFEATAMEEPINVVLKFERQINSHEAEAVCSLLTGDSVLIDSMGNRIEGAYKMRPCGMATSKWCPITRSLILKSLQSEIQWPFSALPKVHFRKTAVFGKKTSGKLLRPGAPW